MNYQNNENDLDKQLACSSCGLTMGESRLLRDLKRGEITLARRAEPSVTEAWLYICKKPGESRTYASVDENDTHHWPLDQWKSVEKIPLVRAALASPAVSQPTALDAHVIDVAFDITDASGPATQVIPAKSVMHHADGSYTVFIDAPAVSQKDGAAVEARDWVEDAPYAHGSCQCKCSTCGHTFIGHRQRDACKACAATTASAPVPHHFACERKGYNPFCSGCEAEREATTASANGQIAGSIDANKLEAMAKEMPDECFLKGSGLLKLIAAIRHLERAQAPSQATAKLYGFDRESLEAIADGLEAGYEKGIDIGGSPLDGIETNIIESTTAAAARFIRAALARAPLPAQGVTNGDQLAALIHYPECWDTAVYPNLSDALREIVTTLKCSECVAAPSQAGDALDEDTERLDYIASKAVRGATYQGVTSVNVIVHEDDLAMGGVRYAIDCMRERAAMSASQGQTGEEK